MTYLRSCVVDAHTYIVHKGIQPEYTHHPHVLKRYHVSISSEYLMPSSCDWPLSYRDLLPNKSALGPLVVVNNELKPC